MCCTLHKETLTSSLDNSTVIYPNGTHATASSVVQFSEATAQRNRRHSLVHSGHPDGDENTKSRVRARCGQRRLRSAPLPAALVLPFASSMIGSTESSGKRFDSCRRVAP